MYRTPFQLRINNAAFLLLEWDILQSTITTNLVAASAHVQCDGTSLVDGCLGSHRPPRSHNSLTSHQNVSATDLVGRQRQSQHVSEQDCACQPLPASYRPHSRVPYAANTCTATSQHMVQCIPLSHHNEIATWCDFNALEVCYFFTVRKQKWKWQCHWKFCSISNRYVCTGP